MPRKLRVAKRRRESISPTAEMYLLTGERPRPGGAGIAGEWWRMFAFGDSDKKLREAWSTWRDVLLPAFIKQHPGRRPAAWWRLEAPEPRRRVGGGNIRAYSPQTLNFGLPVSCVPGFLVGRYAALPSDIDPENPPVFESEAAYLQRLALLTAGEVTRLKPADFQPEAITRVDAA